MSQVCKDRGDETRLITMEGLTTCLDPRRGWTITSGGWNFLKKQERWEGHEQALITTIRKKTMRTEELEEAGYRSPTWAVLRRNLWFSVGFDQGTFRSFAKYCNWSTKIHRNSDGFSIDQWEYLPNEWKVPGSKLTGDQNRIIILILYQELPVACKVEACIFLCHRRPEWWCVVLDGRSGLVIRPPLQDGRSGVTSWVMAVQSILHFCALWLSRLSSWSTPKMETNAPACSNHTRLRP